MDSAKAQKVVKSRYGLGDRRTLDQYIQFSGVDTKARKILGNRCGNLEWVPFQEHPLGADFVPTYDANEDFAEVRDPGSVYFDPSMIGMWQEKLKVASLVLHPLHLQEEKAAPASIIPPLSEEKFARVHVASFSNGHAGGADPAAASSSSGDTSASPRFFVLTMMCAIMFLLYLLFCGSSQGVGSKNAKFYV